MPNGTQRIVWNGYLNINWVEMTKLRGVVEHITYQNPENGWSVMKVKVKDYKDLVTLTGSLLDVPVGSEIGRASCRERVF